MRKAKDFRVELGSTAKCLVTGFTGMVVAAAQWLFNCNTYVVKPRALYKGKPIEGEQIEGPVLKVVKPPKDVMVDEWPFLLKLGSEAKDDITGFSGLVICRTRWLASCNTYTVQPQELKDGKVQDTMVFTEERLTVTKDPGTGGRGSD